MPKSTTRPPRTPKGEYPKVTIANQEREIHNLIKRAQAVVKERDEALASLRSARDEIAAHKRCGEALMADVKERERMIKHLKDANARLLGWQDCGREVIATLGEK